MNTSIEEDLPFEYREISEIAKTKRKDYGNKYMVDRKNLNIRNNHIEQLDAIRNKIGCRSYDNVIEHLIEIEENIDPQFVHTYKCKTCGEEVKNIPEHINVNRFTHKDLCKGNSCKGYIKTEHRMAKDSDGSIIGKKKFTELARQKKMRNGQTDKSEEQSEEQIKKIKLTEEKSGWRDGVRITNMKDPDYDYKYFDIDIVPIREAVQRREKERKRQLESDIESDAESDIEEEYTEEQTEEQTE